MKPNLKGCHFEWRIGGAVGQQMQVKGQTWVVKVCDIKHAICLFGGGGSMAPKFLETLEIILGYFT